MENLNKLFDEITQELTSEGQLLKLENTSTKKDLNLRNMLLSQIA